jgi:hypothetical protein
MHSMKNNYYAFIDAGIVYIKDCMRPQHMTHNNRLNYYF